MSSILKSTRIQKNLKCLMLRIISITSVSCLRIIQSIGLAQWVFCQQCHLLSACGIVCQILFQQIEIQMLFLRFRLHRGYLLKHDYLVLMSRSRLHSQQNVLLCFVFRLRLLISKLFYLHRSSFLHFPCKLERQRQRKLTSRYDTIVHQPVSNVND